MLPKLKREILRGLLPSAAAAATPRGVQGCGALMTSTNACKQETGHSYHFAVFCVQP